MRAKLKEICDIRTGYTFRVKLDNDPSGNVAVVQMKDFDASGRLVANNMDRIISLKPKQKHLIRQGDILFRARGNHTTAAVVEQELGVALAAAPLIVIQIVPTWRLRITPAYLRWWINQREAQQYLKSRREGTCIHTVNLASMRELPIEVPGMDKQEKIVAVAALVEREQEILETLKVKRKLYIQEVLMQTAK